MEKIPVAVMVFLRGVSDMQCYTQNTRCRSRCTSTAAKNKLLPSLILVLNESYVFKRIPKMEIAWTERKAYISKSFSMFFHAISI
jgi:hypothetical protein